MDGSKLVGPISIGDLVKAIISDQKFTIEQLEHYISGRARLIRFQSRFSGEQTAGGQLAAPSTPSNASSVGTKITANEAPQ